MKTTVCISIVCAGLLAATPSVATAAPILFQVRLNTAPLIGDPRGPFFLDFALTDGSGTLAGPNSVTLGNFAFGGGGPVGAPTLTGGATGSLASAVVLSDSANFFNEFFMQFTPGASLRFDVSMTTNADPGFPDAFSVAILDKNLLNLPTTGLADALVLADITPSLTVGGIQTFSTTTPAGVIATVSPIPEPTSLLLFGTGLAALARRRREQDRELKRGR